MCISVTDKKLLCNDYRKKKKIKNSPINSNLDNHVDKTKLGKNIYWLVSLKN